MQTSDTGATTTTIGIDISDKYSRLCVLDGTGTVVDEGRVPTTGPAFRRRFGAMPRARIALEAGAHSHRISRLLAEAGHEVIVANPRRLRLSFAKHVTPGLPPQLSPLLALVLEVIDTLSREIRGYDRRIAAMAGASYPETQRLRQVPGVGPVTALTYILSSKL